MNPFFMFQPIIFPAPPVPAVPEPPKEPARKEEPHVYQYVPNFDSPQPAPPAVQQFMPYRYAGQLLIPLSQIAAGSFSYSQFMAPAQAPAPASAPPVAPAVAPIAAPPAVPANTHIYQGATRSQVDAYNASIAQANGANQPTMLTPYKAKPTQDWWVRELDGTWTLRNTNAIHNHLQPGYWCYGEGGVPCFVRTEKAK
ncbi:MAG: hypothetical protein M1840_005971 [Geoglossum simile]|nr:MAG: hypothetical protein M1840_005971 [Geoglossum simile]